MGQWPAVVHAVEKVLPLPAPPHTCCHPPQPLVLLLFPVLWKRHSWRRYTSACPCRRSQGRCQGCEGPGETVWWVRDRSVPTFSADIQIRTVLDNHPASTGHTQVVSLLWACPLPRRNSVNKAAGAQPTQPPEQRCLGFALRLDVSAVTCSSWLKLPPPASPQLWVGGGTRAVLGPALAPP